MNRNRTLLQISAHGLWAGFMAASLNAQDIQNPPVDGGGSGAGRPVQQAKPEKRVEKQASTLPAPTEANVAYGPHPKQVMDFWKASS
ncbi:MAG: hypothetical protein RLZZ253_2321, partial [Verrucomicrobiota bacterium]